MAITKLTPKTLEDKKKLLDKSAYTLPDNPSDKNFNAHQIKVKMYEPLMMLYEWFLGDETKINSIVDEINTQIDKIKAGEITISLVDKATKDSAGNVIVDTYETKENALNTKTALELAIDKILDGRSSVEQANNATLANKATNDILGRKISDTYALATDYSSILSGAVAVGKANKATADKDGNQIDISYQKVSQKGVAGGYPTLDANGKVPASQTYIADKQVIEVDTYADLPAIGATATLYYVKDQHKVYMWSGSAYFTLEAGLVIGTVTGTAFDGGRGLAVETLATSNASRATALETAVGNKQDKSDNSLLTTVKTVVGAINELFSGKQNTLSSSQIGATNSGITSTKVGNYDSHITDTILHVTASDKANWNAKADGGAFAEYTKTANLGRVALTNSYLDLRDKIDVKVNGVSCKTADNMFNIALSDIYASATDLANEITRATGVENTINSKIPATASSTNLLVDMNTLLDKLSQYSATFRGNFNSLSELQALTGMDINDTAHVKRTDTLGNEYYDLYQYNGTEWVFKYTINNTSFTTNQWASINSGATATIISNTLAHMADTTIHITSTEREALNNLGNKLDKVTTAGTYKRAYGIRTDGVQEVLNINGTSNSLVMTNGDGKIDTNYIPYDSEYFSIVDGLFRPTLDTLINRTSKNPPTTKAVGNALYEEVQARQQYDTALSNALDTLDNAVIHKNLDEVMTGVKTFNLPPVLKDGLEAFGSDNVKYAFTFPNKDGKVALEDDVVTKTDDQTISGIKTFLSDIKIKANSTATAYTRYLDKEIKYSLDGITEKTLLLPNITGESATLLTDETSVTTNTEQNITAKKHFQEDISLDITATSGEYRPTKRIYFDEWFIEAERQYSGVLEDYFTNFYIGQKRQSGSIWITNRYKIPSFSYGNNGKTFALAENIANDYATKADTYTKTESDNKFTSQTPTTFSFTPNSGVTIGHFDGFAFGKMGFMEFANMNSTASGTVLLGNIPSEYGGRWNQWDAVWSSVDGTSQGLIQVAADGRIIAYAVVANKPMYCSISYPIKD